MPKRSLYPGSGDSKRIEQLNKAVDLMLSRADGNVGRADTGVKPLVRIAADLRTLPRGDFKERLKSQLLQRSTPMSVAEPVVTSRSTRTIGMAHITVKNAAEAIKFYEKALGAVETFRFEVGGHIPHAEMRIGESIFGISDEWVEGGRLSAETWGHSPVSFRIHVPDVDSFAARAVAAGMKVKMPLSDQFYGYREGNFVDPFGYTWNLVTVKEEMSVAEMHRRMNRMSPEGGQPSAPSAETKTGVSPIPSGYRTVTPYLVAQDANAVIDFVKKTFGGEELFRAVGSAGGYHVEVRVDDSMLMIGGGGAGVGWKGKSMPGAFHIYVRDCDAAYERALQAGGKSMHGPADQEYGERSASVIDAEGNHWYIATYKDTGFKWEGAPTIQPYMHPLRAEPVINFLRRAFGAEELGRYTSPDGVIHHTTLKIGSSHLEMGEAQGPYQPMKSMYYLYVPDVDAVYARAVAAGAKSIHEPTDQPYGDRSGAVTDIFGYQWWIATHVKDVTP
jgi:PhnB protein